MGEDLFEHCHVMDLVYLNFVNAVSYCFAASVEKIPVITTNKDEHPAKQQVRKEDFVCPVCYDDFTFLHDLRQHLIHDDCQPENGDSLDCNICTLSFADVDELKDHRLSHMNKTLFSCLACGTNFSSKRTLDRHMFVDASILNKLRSSKEVMSLPDLLCRTVVDILAESAGISGSVGKAVKMQHSSDDEEVEDDENEKGVSKAKVRRKEYVEEEEDMAEDEDNDEELDDEDDNDVAEDCDESNLPSEIEQDLEEAEDSEEAMEISKIPQPFISSSLTDAPLPPFPNDLDNDDSVTSLSHNSAGDAVDTSANACSSSSSRRKSKHPMQVQRVAPASPKVLKMAETVIKVEPEDDEEVNMAGLWNEFITCRFCCLLFVSSLIQQHTCCAICFLLLPLLTAGFMFLT